MCEDIRVDRASASTPVDAGFRNLHPDRNGQCVRPRRTDRRRTSSAPAEPGTRPPRRPDSTAAGLQQAPSPSGHHPQGRASGLESARGPRPAIRRKDLGSQPRTGRQVRASTRNGIHHDTGATSARIESVCALPHAVHRVNTGSDRRARTDCRPAGNRYRKRVRGARNRTVTPGTTPLHSRLRLHRTRRAEGSRPSDTSVASAYGRGTPTAAARQMDRPKQERRHHGHPAAPWQVDIRNPWPARAIPGDRPMDFERPADPGRQEGGRTSRTGRRRRGTSAHPPRMACARTPLPASSTAARLQQVPTACASHPRPQASGAQRARGPRGAERPKDLAG